MSSPYKSIFSRKQIAECYRVVLGKCGLNEKQHMQQKKTGGLNIVPFGTPVLGPKIYFFNSLMFSF